MLMLNGHDPDKNIDRLTFLYYKIAANNRLLTATNFLFLQKYHKTTFFLQKYYRQTDGAKSGNVRRTIGM